MWRGGFLSSNPKFRRGFIKNQKGLDIFDIKGKVIVLTGGKGFLGQRFAQDLASCGAILCLVDLFPDKRGYGKEDFFSCDITDKSKVLETVRKIVDRYRKIDVLINNAGVKTPNNCPKFEDLSLEEWEKSLSVNLTGMFIFTQAVVPYMIREKHGSIINVSSIYGLVGPDFRIYGDSKMTTSVAYSTTKAGVIGFTRYLSTYLGASGIRANSITPGGVFNNQDPEFVKNYSLKTPLKRMAKPDDLIGAMRFLSSNASSYITGQNLIVDGGWTAW